MDRKVESDLILNIKEVESFRKENITNKFIDKRLQINQSLDKYNEHVKKALNAPIPEINLHYNEVVLTAVPAEMKSKGGIILGTGNLHDFAVAEKLTRMSHATSFFQEILMVGPMVTKEEIKAGIRPGRMARIKLDRYRALSDSHMPGMIETHYDVPQEMIDGFPYLIMDKRDIMYTRDK